jgi:putative membrane protein
LRETGQQAGLDQSHPALQRWYAAIHETQNDREVVSLYAQLVQPVLDAQARREISRSAAESTLMIAVSPLALVDMAFIAWRNLRLINRIATCTALSWVTTAACDCSAGAAEYRLCRRQRTGARSGHGLDVAGSGGQSFGACGAGDWRRTADRASGIKAMELCRPLPWIADDKPRLGDFRRELIGQLKETLQKVKAVRSPDFVTAGRRVLLAARGFERISLRHNGHFSAMLSIIVDSYLHASK